MINPDASVWIEEEGQKTLLSRIHFDQGALEAGLEVIANRYGKKLNADSPIMNVRNHVNMSQSSNDSFPSAMMRTDGASRGALQKITCVWSA
jgi:Flp pilus assembly CpaF family ATPase